MKKSILLILLFIPFISCQSSGQKDLPPREMNVASGEKSGKVGTVILKNKILTLVGENITIGCSLNSESFLSLLNHSETYNFFGFVRPDGPVRTLIFEDSEMMTAWIGDGIRSGMGPEGLKIEAAGNILSIRIQSDSASWIIPAEKETIISWQGQSWTVYASNVMMGELQDQPPFAADVVIFRE